ncbi:MAG: hypothetical protein IJS60_05430 [Abditibacteriota bacterium]|nr:hypothetical protein [Abditibacteriota bacterium]
MKVNIIIFILIYIVIPCFSNPILEKLTEIDNQMNNGKVEYIMKGSDKKVGTQKIIFSYLESGIYKKEISFESGRSITVYNDGKDIVRVSENGITLDKKSDSDRANPYSDVLPKASCIYGRGLTRLNNVTIKNNILKGDEYGYFVKAYLDPNYDYLCYKLEIISPKGLIIDTLTNKKPVLVDNKYYIYTESSRKKYIKRIK